MSDLDVTVLVPCRHEQDNIRPLVARLASALARRRVQVMFIDDSDDDETIREIQAAARQWANDELRIAVVHRDGSARWGGLAGAVTDGLRRARAGAVVVMDADLQHPPELVPVLLDRLGEPDRPDVVMASRYTAGGDPGGLDGPLRRAVSTTSTWLARVMFPVGLRGVSDPMTGFFALRRAAVGLDRLRPGGFKILLEILASHPTLRRREVPFVFGTRYRGASKGDVWQGLAYLRQLPRLRLASTARSFRTATPRLVLAGRRAVANLRNIVASRRVRDFAVGGGVVALVGALLLELLVAGGAAPAPAYAVMLAATLAANFSYNYLVTWRDRAREGLRRGIAWFLATRASTLLLSWLAFGLLTGIVGLHHQIANVLCLTGAAALNYYVSDRVVFAQPHEVPAGARRFARLLVAVAVVASVAASAIMARVSGSTALAVSLLAIAVFNTVIGTLEIRWRLYGWRDPDVVQKMRWPEPRQPDEAAEKFSLIVPALHEAEVIGGTLRRLLQTDYPHVEIVVSLCEGDNDTLREVDAVMREHDLQGRIRTVVRAYTKSNKPRQLNAALEECTGTVIGVIDAEDDVAHGLLSRVDALFQKTEADVVQGGVQLMTLGRRASDWFKVHNVLEYFFWFSSRVFFQVRHGFVPLGGNTVFIRRDLLVRAGGWPDNLTEDCALGVLLCTRYDAKVVAAYEPDHATREEVPPTIADRTRGSLFWQRVRWNQGFLSVLLERDWLTLPTLRQRVLAFYILATPFLQALSALLIPLALLTTFSLKVPVGVAMVLYAPFVPIFMTMTMQLVGLAEFSRAYGQRAGLRHYVYLIAGAPIYSWVLMAAAFWAVVQHLQGNTTWHKTVHSGHHREFVLARQTEAA